MKQFLEVLTVWDFALSVSKRLFELTKVPIYQKPSSELSL